MKKDFNKLDKVKNIILNEKYSSSSFFLEKAKGDKIFLKNKSFLDMSFCNGVMLLGHNNKIYKESIKKYLQKNFSIFSNPNTQAIKLSKTLKYFFPKFKKIVFCNSGSESVIKAIRLSRATNIKKKLVLVTGSWHGSTDQTLFYPKKNLSPESLSAGLKDSDKKDVIFIPYNNINDSKKILDKYFKNINCILIEPVMSSLPIKNGKPYLKFLEKYCKSRNINLIFDEIITGFRSKNGSVQKQYKIKPDITLIGKVLGGGLPIAAIGITDRIYKNLQKTKKKVFFGGTFSANTLSTFVGNDAISFIKKNDQLIKNLIAKCKYFEDKINYFIIENKLSIKVYRFDSILRIVFTDKEIQSRVQRDFLEKKQVRSKQQFVKFLLKKNIIFPSNGVILFSLMTSKKSIDHIIKSVSIGLKKYFNKK